MAIMGAAEKTIRRPSLSNELAHEPATNSGAVSTARSRPLIPPSVSPQ